MTKEELLEQMMGNISAIRRLMISCLFDHDGGLPPSQAELLFLVAQDGPLPLSKLAKTMGLTAGAVSQLAENLEKAGLIERQPSQTDRRVTNIAVSKLGMERIHELNKRKIDLFAEAYKELSIEDLRVMNTAQNKMIEHLQRVSKKVKE